MDGKGGFKGLEAVCGRFKFKVGFEQGMVGLKPDEGGFGLGEWVYSGFRMDLGLVQGGGLEWV